MTVDQYDLMRAAARALLAEEAEGQRCDPYAVAWARQVVRNGWQPKPAEVIAAETNECEVPA